MTEPIDTPIDVREATLPGVGKKYTMSLRDGGNLALVVKPDGERQMYHFLEDEDRPCDVFKVDKEEAQQLANLLGQPMVSAPDLQKLELALGALEIEWIKLEQDSALVGQTLQDVPLRTETGASVVAIMRGEDAIANPDLSTVFRAGDTVMIIGSHEQCEAAQALILG